MIEKIKNERNKKMNGANYIKIILTGVGTSIGYFLGGFDIMLITLLIFMVIDYITGIMCAVINKTLSSEIGFRGIFKKLLIILLVGLVNLLGKSINIEGLRYIAISFYIANEGLSIIENASIIGVPIPEKIKDILEQLKSKGDE